MDHAHFDSSVATSTPTGGSRSYSDDFKRDAVRLISDENSKFKAAAKPVGVSEKGH